VTTAGVTVFFTGGIGRLGAGCGLDGCFFAIYSAVALEKTFAKLAQYCEMVSVSENYFFEQPVRNE